MVSDKNHQYNEILLLFHLCCKMYTDRALDSNVSKSLPTKTYNFTFSLDFRKRIQHLKLGNLFQDAGIDWVDFCSYVVHTNQAKKEVF